MLIGGMLVLLGLVCLTIGIGLRIPVSDIDRMLRSGHCSTKAVLQKTGIVSQKDLTTKKEEMLYRSFSGCHWLCIQLTEMLMDSARVEVILGILLVFLGSRTVFAGNKMRRLVAEPPVPN